MEFIYEEAKQVIVFMGDGRGHRINRSHLKELPVSPMTDLHGHERERSFLTGFLRALHRSAPKQLDSSLTGAAYAMGLIALFSDPDMLEEGCMELMKLSEANRCHLFELLRAFVTCPWWSRIWVVQEIAVSTVVAVQYGTITLPWESLVATANTWSLPKTRQVANSAGIEPENLKVFALFANQLIGLEQARRKWHDECGTELVRLLQEFSDRQATDDRDKVYGLLSLVKLGQWYIEPDYSLSTFETYMTTALALIEKHKSLACWTGDQKRKSKLGFPSWIPDWSTAVDTGDKRRLDLFDSYSVNGGWTLKVIDSEIKYWRTAESQLALLINSPAGKAERLPASLSPFVLEYIEALMQRARSLLHFDVDTDELMRSDTEHLIWDKSQWVTSGSPLHRLLQWCEKHEVFPRSGRTMLWAWVGNLIKRQLRARQGQVGERTNDSFVQVQVCAYLLHLAAAIEDYDMDIGSQIIYAQRFIHGIECVKLVSRSGASLGRMACTNMRDPISFGGYGDDYLESDRYLDNFTEID